MHPAPPGGFVGHGPVIGFDASLRARQPRHARAVFQRRVDRLTGVDNIQTDHLQHFRQVWVWCMHDHQRMGFHLFGSAVNDFQIRAH